MSLQLFAHPFASYCWKVLIALYADGTPFEYKLLDQLRGRTNPLIIPLNFPDAPDVSNPEAALNATLGQLRHWYLAPTNPAQLASANIPFALTTDGLSSINQFLPNLRIAVTRGLAPDMR